MYQLWKETGDGGYPEGGSLAMTERMAQTFKSLGSKLLLNTKVKKAVIENEAVTGVMLENETLSADAMIVTQETIAAPGSANGLPSIRYGICVENCVENRIKLP
jgi:phytoene dehydrogenase-like protein